MAPSSRRFREKRSLPPAARRAILDAIALCLRGLAEIDARIAADCRRLAAEVLALGRPGVP